MVNKGYKQTEVGVIPEDWAIGYLSDFGNVQSGGTPSTTIVDYWGGSIAWCTPSDITSTPTKYINSTQRTITDAGLKNSAAIVMPVGSILLCTRATIGELKINSIPMATNQGFKNITIDDSGNAEFFYYLLQTKTNSMLELAIGSTFLEISKTALCKIPLQIPMRDEQDKIADALSDIDNLIVVLEKQIAKKKAIKQGAMQELLTGKRRLPGFAGEWEKTVLGTVSSFYTGGTPSKKREDWWNGDIPWISSSDLTEDAITSVNINRYISKDAVEHSATRICPKDAVLVVSRVGVGKVAVAPCELCTSQDFTTIVPHRHNPHFLAYMLIPVMKELAMQAQGTSIKGVTVEDIQKIIMPTPTIDEQNQIVDILANMDSEIEALEQKLEKYRQVKQGMMQQLLTGKIRLV